MEKSIIAEGKTTNEAIEKGLKELNVSKNMVDIKICPIKGLRHIWYSAHGILYIYYKLPVQSVHVSTHVPIYLYLSSSSFLLLFSH